MFLFPASPAQRLMKNISKNLFRLITSTTEIIEFENVKFPKEYHLKMVFGDNFLRLTVTVRFQEKEYLKSVNFLIKFTFHLHFENHGFTSLIILQVLLEVQKRIFFPVQ